jgi:hypothetical protein
VKFEDINVLKYLIGSSVDLYIENTTKNEFNEDIRKYDSLRLDLMTGQTRVYPTYEWYLNPATQPENTWAKGIGIFYSSGGVGHFFEWFMPY